MVTLVIDCCITCEAQLSEQTFKRFLCCFTGLMVPVSDGQSQCREGESSRGSDSHRPYTLPSSAETGQRGDTVFQHPADGKTWVAPHYFCLMHTFMFLLLWPEKVNYSSVLKGYFRILAMEPFIYFPKFTWTHGYHCYVSVCSLKDVAN